MADVAWSARSTLSDRTVGGVIRGLFSSGFQNLVGAGGPSGETACGGVIPEARTAGHGLGGDRA
jgi:hypothetical protein